MKQAIQSANRSDFNSNSGGAISHITDGHKAVFMALTSGEPNLCLTSIYVNGEPAVAIVLIGREEGTITTAPSFVILTSRMKLNDIAGEEWKSG